MIKVGFSIFEREDMVFSILGALLFNPLCEIETVQKELAQYMPERRWTCQEIGNGNINFIYLADGGDLKVIVKKDLDFARINPEQFPLPVERLLYEYRSYILYGKIIPERVPNIYFFNLNQGMLGIEFFPYTILRQGILSGEKYPLLADHLGTFLARSLYFSSRYHLPKDEWEQHVALFSGNTAMRNIILDLNYTAPFYGSPLNTWTSPELNEQVAEIQNDKKIKSIVNQLKEKLLANPEALSHGDLHTGSILASSTDTRIIDTEFASYAPISFDIGMLLGNFAIATLAAEAHHIDRRELAQITREIWDIFADNFHRLWTYQDIKVEEKLNEIWIDTLRLMGIEIIRRTIGIAHTADFETIAERRIKAAIEIKALQLAKQLLLETHVFVNSKTLEDCLTKE